MTCLLVMNSPSSEAKKPVPRASKWLLKYQQVVNDFTELKNDCELGGDCCLPAPQKACYLTDWKDTLGQLLLHKTNIDSNLEKHTVEHLQSSEAFEKIVAAAENYVDGQRKWKRTFETAWRSHKKRLEKA